jgi:hypothetical protein
MALRTWSQGFNCINYAAIGSAVAVYRATGQCTDCSADDRAFGLATATGNFVAEQTTGNRANNRAASSSVTTPIAAIAIVAIVTVAALVTIVATIPVAIILITIATIRITASIFAVSVATHLLVISTIIIAAARFCWRCESHGSDCCG